MERGQPMCDEIRTRLGEIEALLMFAVAIGEEGEMARIGRPGNLVFIAFFARSTGRNAMNRSGIAERSGVNLRATFLFVHNPGDPLAVRRNGRLVRRADSL